MPPRRVHAGPVAAGIARIDRSAIDDRRGPRRIMVDFDHASAHTVPVGGNADDRDVLTRTRRVAVAVLVCSIALSACSPSGPESVSPPTAASPVNSLPVTPSPTLALATPSPLPGGAITTYAGRDFAGDGGPATAARLLAPAGVALDPAGNLYIADTADHRIRKVTPGGTISTYAGSGNFGFSGDGGPATAAELNFPLGVALDPAGNLYIADHANSRIRKVTSGGTISTYAGSGSRGLSGDGGPATAAQLYSPHGVALDTAGNLYIADSNRIRKVTPGRTISTYTCTGTGPFSGAAGPATAPQLNVPVRSALAPARNLYLAASGSSRIRNGRAGGTISTSAGAGGGTPGFSGDGGPATAAYLNNPVGVTLDPAGNLYIADTYNARIRKVTPTVTISTTAATSSSASLGAAPPPTAPPPPLRQVAGD